MSIEILGQSADGAIIACSVWIFTYLLHSTLLLGSAWLACRYGGRLLNDPIRELIWKVAVLGGVITATLQVGCDVIPFGGRIALEARPPSADRSYAPSEKFANVPWKDDRQAAEKESEPIARLLEGISRSGGTPAGEERIAPYVTRVDESVENGRADHSTPVWWSRALALGVAALLLGGIFFTLRARRRLLSRLAGRKSTGLGRLRSILDTLCAQAGVSAPIRLTWSSQITVPLALGIVRREICLPRRALGGLPLEQQEAMVAHELAHLIRHDPAWQALVHFLGSVFFFQPLNRLVPARLREASEFSCDALSAELAGRPLALAQCLTEVAGWVTARRAGTAGAAAVGMAGAPSILARRIERLLSEQFGRTRPLGRGCRFLAPALFLAAVTLIVPSVEAVTPSVGKESASHEIEAGNRLRHDTIFAPLIDAVGALDREISLLEEEIAALRESWRKMDGREQSGVVLLERLDKELDRMRLRRETVRDAVTKISREFSADMNPNIANDR